MGKASVLICLLFLAGLWIPSASAGSDEFCSKIGTLAAKVMSARQHGVTLDAMLSVLTGAEGIPPASRLAVRQMVLTAYSTPRFSTEGYQARAISDFRDGVQLTCLRQQ